MDEIKVNCKAADTLDIQDMTLFQGELKSRTDSDYEHIKKSILEYGFCAPFFIWEHDGINSVLDGTGRYETLQRMKNAGYDIPLLPVAYIDCKDEATAKQKLLRLNSHYGYMTSESVKEFVGDMEIDYSDISLPEGTLDFSKLEEYETGTEEGVEDMISTFGVTLNFDKRYEPDIKQFVKDNGKQAVVEQIISMTEATE